jgi:hypothetical protein
MTRLLLGATDGISFGELKISLAIDVANRYSGKCRAKIRSKKPRTSVVNKKILIDLIGVLLIALVVVVGYKLSPLLLPKADVTVQPDPGCDLQRRACTVELPGRGKIELSMGTRPVPMVKPFSIEVTSTGFSPDRVEVDFSGVDMDMGLNRPHLAARGDGRYGAEVMLPVCITGKMDWQVTVLVETGSERIAIPYRLASEGLQ